MCDLPAAQARKLARRTDAQRPRHRKRGTARPAHPRDRSVADGRSEEHTSELQSLMRISYAVFCLKKKITTYSITPHTYTVPTPYYTRQATPITQTIHFNYHN